MVHEKVSTCNAFIWKGQVEYRENNIMKKRTCLCLDLATMLIKIKK